MTDSPMAGLAAGVDGRQLGHEVLAVLEHAGLLGLGGPARLELVAWRATLSSAAEHHRAR
jgi:hypothetical protein